MQNALRRLRPTDRELSWIDDGAWASRCAFWIGGEVQKPQSGPSRRRQHVPLVITGHGARLNVNNGALVVQDGFTHYPQKAAQHRFFPGDPKLPSRIVIVDGSGSLSFDAIDWLAAQKVPLIRLNWRGEVQTILAGTGYSADPKKVAKQLEAKRKERDLEISIGLIRRKIKNSIETLKKCFPVSPNLVFTLAKLEHANQELSSTSLRSTSLLLGIEGKTAAAYFDAWRDLPVAWKGTGRRPIPKDWYFVGSRSSVVRKKARNRNASHPVNAMLNYAYAILQSQVHRQVLIEGYDPTIGFLHKTNQDRQAFVFDLMEPLRPIADRKVLEFVQENTFYPADFTLRADGVCRLNPEMARHVVGLVTKTIAVNVWHPCNERKLFALSRSSTSNGRC